MKLRRLSLLAVLLLVATLLPLAALGGNQVPYKATLASTSFTIVFPGLGDTGRCAALPTDALPPGTGWGLITINAVGNSTQMGLVADVQSHCSVLPFDPSASPPVGAVIPFVLGQTVLTGANGDSITGVYEGTLTVTDAGMVINGHLTTIDGTGRFAGANGEATAFGVQSAAGATLTLTGTMSSIGSLKKK